VLSVVAAKLDGRHAHSCILRQSNHGTHYCSKSALNLTIRRVTRIYHGWCPAVTQCSSITHKDELSLSVPASVRQPVQLYSAGPILPTDKYLMSTTMDLQYCRFQLSVGILLPPIQYVGALVVVYTTYCALQIVRLTLHYITSVRASSPDKPCSTRRNKCQSNTCHISFTWYRLQISEVI